MDAIERYRPKLPGPVWDRVGPDCRRAVAAAKPVTPKEARDWLGALAHAAAYADASGRPTKAEHLLTAEAIEWYLATGCLHLEESSRSNRRCRLNKLRRALLGPDLITGNPAAYSGSDASRPYTQPEQAQLYATARAQPTDELRYNCLLLLALGFGCALDSPEIIPLRTHDVREAPNGAVAVAVRGPRARVVLCRTAWAPVLTEATAWASRPGQARYLFRPSSYARGTNTVTNFLARTKKPPGTPPLVIGRARATWLVDAIEARMHLPTLMAAAGLTTLRSIDRVLPHVRNLSPDQAAAALKEF
ncbi:hypothetical protein D0Z67_14790 [Streptomyces seoulensis]|uniref:Site-specific integrase n=1 Tax=Streptomyces seoulensis TaxID=73044 RepID=A0A4V0ZZK7_STRSO|nr:hypothetical protein [Streptomyces seoulensis]QBJ91426.1 hypothetical protein D0Z67_14790 [Streptomyces seoulensis]